MEIKSNYSELGGDGFRPLLAGIALPAGRELQAGRSALAVTFVFRPYSKYSVHRVSFQLLVEMRVQRVAGLPR